MKGKRILLCVLSAAVAVSSAGCGKKNTETVKEGDYAGYGYHETGYPIVDKPLTLKAVARKNPLHGNWDESYWGEYAEKKTGIKMEYEYIDVSAWEQKKQLMFAADNLPDLFIGGYNGINKIDEIAYGTGGLIIPLNDLIEKHAPDIVKMYEKKPEVKADTTAPDGNIYTLPTTNSVPTVNGGLRVWTNEVWLKNLGVERPSTIDELNDVLYSFRDNDPDGNGKKDTYAISGVYTDPEGDIKNFFMCAYGILGDDFYVKDGKVVFGPMEPNFKEYLREMNFLYKEGLIDKDYFTQTMSEYKAKSSTGKVGMGVWSAPAAGGGMDLKTADEYAYTKAVTSKYNDFAMWSRGEENCSTGHFAITKSNKYPEASIRWANIWYTEEGGIVAECGPRHGTFKKQPDIGYEIDENGEWYSNDTTGESDSWATFNRWGAPAADGCAFGLKPEFVAKKRDAKVGKFYEALASNDAFYENGKKHGIEALPNSFYFTKDEQENMALILTEARDYVKQLQAKFITGAEPIDNYDSFVSKLKGYNIESVCEKYQTAYDNYIKKIKE